jgi:hypothetical protein
MGILLILSLAVAATLAVFLITGLYLKLASNKTRAEFPAALIYLFAVGIMLVIAAIVNSTLE